MAEWMTLQSSRHQVAIAGMVSDAQTGQVISGAKVKLSKGSAEFSRWLNLKAMQYGDALSQQGSVRLSSKLSLERDQTGLYLATQTALQGHFYFIDLPSGSYDLFVFLPGAGTRYGTQKIENVSVTERNGKVERAIADIRLPPTGIKGRIVGVDGQPIVMAKLQIEGSSGVTFSDHQGDYLLTGMEVWQQPEKSSNAPRPLITVSAQGYQSATTGTWLVVGEVKPLEITLTRSPLN